MENKTNELLNTNDWIVIIFDHFSYSSSFWSCQSSSLWQTWEIDHTILFLTANFVFDLLVSSTKLLTPSARSMESFMSTSFLRTPLVRLSIGTRSTEDLILDTFSHKLRRAIVPLIDVEFHILCTLLSDPRSEECHDTRGRPVGHDLS